MNISHSFFRKDDVAVSYLCKWGRTIIFVTEYFCKFDNVVTQGNLGYSCRGNWIINDQVYLIPKCSNCKAAAYLQFLLARNMQHLENCLVIKVRDGCKTGSEEN